MRLIQSLSNFILPNYCLHCYSRAEGPLLLCNDCKRALPLLPTSCRICAAACAMPEPAVCARCITKPPYFDRTIALFPYHRPISSWITHLKFNHQLHYAKLLGRLFTQKIWQLYNANLPEILIPMPLHKTRLRERGFNQSLEIARPIAHNLSIPLDYTLCIRHKNTQPQSAMRAKERIANLKKAFHLSRKIAVKHVAILDDVMTTGTTVNELSRLFKRNGVKKIDIWCCARAELKFS